MPGFQYSKYNLFGLTVRPLRGGKSNCPQHWRVDPICFAPVIQSGPPNEPSSILGHFALQTHTFQGHLCHLLPGNHLTLHWSHLLPLLRHQHVRNLKVTTPSSHTFAQLHGKVPRMLAYNTKKLEKTHFPNWNVTNIAGPNMHETPRLTYVGTMTAQQQFQHHVDQLNRHLGKTCGHSQWEKFLHVHLATFHQPTKDRIDTCPPPPGNLEICVCS